MSLLITMVPLKWYENILVEVKSLNVRPNDVFKRTFLLTLETFKWQWLDLPRSWLCGVLQRTFLLRKFTAFQPSLLSHVTFCPLSKPATHWSKWRFENQMELSRLKIISEVFSSNAGRTTVHINEAFSGLTMILQAKIGIAYLIRRR